MNIEKVESLNYGSFSGFRWKADLPSFCKLNVLLGWNGSGKTTLSRVFRFFENGSTASGGAFRITIDGASVTEKDNLAQFRNKIRVFNQDYIQEVLRGDSSIPQLFYLGGAAVDFSIEEEELQSKKKEFNAVVCKPDHDQIARAVAETIKRVTGINKYNKEITSGSYTSYNITDFKKRIESISKYLESEAGVDINSLILEDIDNAQNDLVRVNPLQDVYLLLMESKQWLEVNKVKINACLAVTPSQQLLQRIDDMSEFEQTWVGQGVKLHFRDEPEATNCKFCENPIKNKEELVNHFSEDLDMLIATVDLFYQGAIDKKDALKAALDRVDDELKIALGEAMSLFSTIIDSLVSKKQKLSVKVDSVGAISFPAWAKPIEEEKKDLAHSIELHYVAKKYEEYLSQKKAHDDCQQKREALSAQILEMKSHISELKGKAKNTHKAAEWLNSVFKVSFPYRRIEIADNADSTGYVLSRNGHECSFSSLSEGERNLLALMYFLASLNSEQNKLDRDGIVVFDDPVSSLDKKSIFQIFSHISKEISNDANDRQYLILTHNLDFFSHIREHFKGRVERTNKKGLPEPTCLLYSLVLDEKGSNIEKLHKLLRDHKSDYYYSFSVLYRFKDACSLEDAYMVINLLRRWLETFLEFKFPSNPDLRMKIENAFAEVRKSNDSFVSDPIELYRFVNHGSHDFTDMDSIDESLLANASDYIRTALRMAELLDPLHYKKLEGCIK